jgi:hypothetical protein
LGALPFRRANLTACREDPLHEIISSEGPARAPPILSTSRLGVIGKQGGDLSLQGGHPFF